ncbi:MAG: SGNH/GDSL hydrolase family protein, partial [Candidatus Dormibacteria bacterium]
SIRGVAGLRDVRTGWKVTAGRVDTQADRRRGWSLRSIPLVCLLALLPLAATVGPATSVAGAAAPIGPFVALGDSYTAGPLIPNLIEDSGPCGRSDHDYPALIAFAKKVPVFHDVSCGGASTDSMWTAQFPRTARQLDAVRSDSWVVSIGVGANDIGLMGLATTCSALGLVDSIGSPCKDYYTAGGVDQNAVAIAATALRIGDILATIRRHAPRARVLVVGYPDIFPQTGPGCWPVVPIAPGDLPYLRSVELALNAMLATQAANNGATFVDTYSSSIGHDVCKEPGTRWVEWLVVGSAAAPLHPNILAMQNDALQVLAALGR